MAQLLQWLWPGAEVGTKRGLGRSVRQDGKKKRAGDHRRKVSQREGEGPLWDAAQGPELREGWVAT